MCVIENVVQTPIISLSFYLVRSIYNAERGVLCKRNASLAPFLLLLVLHITANQSVQATTGAHPTIHLMSNL